jgi:hypothetical protein
VTFAVGEGEKHLEHHWLEGQERFGIAGEHMI